MKVTGVRIKTAFPIAMARTRSLPALSLPGGQQNGKHHYGQILDQSDPDHDLAMFRPELSALDQEA